MGLVTSRTVLTSRGLFALSPWNDTNYTYSTLLINTGTNPLSKLEVVSALNSLNTASYQYHYNYANSVQKYNFKLYLSTIQSMANQWIYDNQTGQTNGLPNLQNGNEKSGSCSCF